tara:strand:+ start:3750 stop:4823 length:1074 start_codon:yes stop_codon:yes gene_type:complete
MPSELTAARDLANKVRFCDDRLGSAAADGSRHSISIKNSFYCNELAISEKVTPALERSLCSALHNLHIARSVVEAFVYPSSEINAQCFSGADSECVIRLSSALIEILTTEEVGFVVGHEMGHFLLSHQGQGDMNSEGNVEDYIRYRAQEISADRIGVIASGSLETALRAMLKTISGLSSKHLRFDMSKFISQIRSTSGVVNQHEQSTHPSVLVRSRALLWFSISGFDVFDGLQNTQGVSTADVDRRVRVDMDRYVDGEAKDRLKDARAELAMWVCARNIVESGSFSKQAQDRFRADFDENTLTRLAAFLQGQSAEENEGAVEAKLRLAQSKLEALMPTSYSGEYSRLVEKYGSFASL